jgi:hypothetical protein
MVKHIAFDPSGNWGKEGMGTTGYCISTNGVPQVIGEIKASDYESEVSYWFAHKELIEGELPDHVTIEGYKLYNHKGKEAKMQANSELQTPQLIGALKLVCREYDIPYNIQFASEVKTRWSEDVLVRLGILEQKGNRYYWNGELTNTHKRDSLKHSNHFWRYKHERS